MLLETPSQVEYKYLLCGVNGQPKEWEARWYHMARVMYLNDLPIFVGNIPIVYRCLSYLSPSQNAGMIL